MNTNALMSASTSQSGRYGYEAQGGFMWSYAYDVSAPRSSSERREGKVRVGGKPIEGARFGDRIQTPWGVMQLTGSAHEEGWLLEGALKRSFRPWGGKLIWTPACLPTGNLRWTASSAKWQYALTIMAKGTKNEIRAGRLFHEEKEVTAAKVGDRVQTPWGMMYCMGPVQGESPAGGHEEGWLLQGTMDRSLEGMEGDLISLRGHEPRYRAPRALRAVNTQPTVLQETRMPLIAPANAQGPAAAHAHGHSYRLQST
jgi:hypothetical protein